MQACQHCHFQACAKLLVTEVRRRASNQSTEAAASAIASFLEVTIIFFIGFRGDYYLFIFLGDDHRLFYSYWRWPSSFYMFWRQLLSFNIFYLSDCYFSNHYIHTKSTAISFFLEETTNHNRFLLFFLSERLNSSLISSSCLSSPSHTLTDIQSLVNRCKNLFMNVFNTTQQLDSTRWR